MKTVEEDANSFVTTLGKRMGNVQRALMCGERVSFQIETRELL